MVAPMDSAGLLVIDVQQGFDHPKWGRRNNLQAEANIGRLLSHWRAEGRQVLHVQHCSTSPDSPLKAESPGCEFKDVARPQEGEPVFQKNVNSAFIGTQLEAYLHEHKIETLVIVGLTTDHCVSTTTRMAGNLGFTAFVVSDATATFDRAGPDGTVFDADELHDVSLASLHDEFATVVTTDTVLD
jgi:nicotinamidase-related amidase